MFDFEISGHGNPEKPPFVVRAEFLVEQIPASLIPAGTPRANGATKRNGPVKCGHSMLLIRGGDWNIRGTLVKTLTQKAVDNESEGYAFAVGDYGNNRGGLIVPAAVYRSQCLR